MVSIFIDQINIINMKKRSKYLIIVTAIFSLSSCGSVPRDYFGTYSNIYRGGKYAPSLHYLKIEADSTFSYYYGSGWHEEISNGHWTINSEKNKLFLFSNLKNIHCIPLVVEESFDSKTEQQIINFANLAHDSTLWSIVINGEKLPIKSDRLLFSCDVNIDSFYIEGYKNFTNIRPFPLQERIKSMVYYVKNSGNNILQISLPKYVDYNIYNYLPITDSLHINKKHIVWKRNGQKLMKQP
jgi:hypothetical protein